MRNICERMQEEWDFRVCPASARAGRRPRAAEASTTAIFHNNRNDDDDDDDYDDNDNDDDDDDDDDYDDEDIMHLVDRTTIDDN